MIDDFEKSPLRIRHDVDKLAQWLQANHARLGSLAIDDATATGLLVTEEHLDGTWFIPLSDEIQLGDSFDEDRMRIIPPAIDVESRDETADSPTVITVGWRGNDDQLHTSEVAPEGLRFMINADPYAVEPVMEWDSRQPFNDKVMWWRRADGRYQAEVQLITKSRVIAEGVTVSTVDNRFAEMYVFDRHDQDRVVYTEGVSLPPTGFAGADVEQAAIWDQKFIDFLGNLADQLSD